MSLAILSAIRGAAAAAPADFRADIAKVTGTTAVRGHMEGTMDVPIDHVFAVLCDYDHYDDFVQTVAAQAVVPPQVSERLIRERPKDPKAIRGDIKVGMVKAECPGTADTLAYQDYPFPIADGWLLSRYTATREADGYRLAYVGLAGSGGESKGVWTLKPRGPDRTFLTMDYSYDLGLRVPEFLIKWGAATEMPGMFDGIERLARQRAGTATAGTGKP